MSLRMLQILKSLLLDVMKLLNDLFMSVVQRCFLDSGRDPSVKRSACIIPFITSRCSSTFLLHDRYVYLQDVFYGSVILDESTSRLRSGRNHKLLELVGLWLEIHSIRNRNLTGCVYCDWSNSTMGMITRS